MAEIAVHFSLATLADDYLMLTIEIPDDVSSRKVEEAELPVNWKEFPHPSSSQKIGDRFVSENEHCILIIPPVVTQGDFNILINPRHPEFERIKVTNCERFPFDRRIFR